MNGSHLVLAEKFLFNIAEFSAYFFDFFAVRADQAINVARAAVLENAATMAIIKNLNTVTPEQL